MDALSTYRLTPPTESLPRDADAQMEELAPDNRTIGAPLEAARVADVSRSEPPEVKSQYLISKRPLRNIHIHNHTPTLHGRCSRFLNLEGDSPTDLAVEVLQLPSSRTSYKLPAIPATRDRV